MCATKKLSEICEIVNWWTPDTWNSSYWDGDILWITPKDMWKLEDIYVSDTFRKITEQWLKNSSAKIFPQNSIILSSRAPIWHLAINTVPMCTNQGCKWLIPWNDLDAKYLYYFLLNSVDLLNSLWTGTTFKELSSTKLKEIQIPLPPLSTQASIVERLDSAMVEIDEARRQTESALASAREVWESTLENSVLSWEEKTLWEVCDLFQGLAINAKTKHLLVENSKLPLLRIKDLRNNTVEQYVSEIWYPKNALITENDILYTRTGQIWLVFTWKHGVLHNNAFKVSPKAWLNKDFLFWFLQAPIFKNKIIYLATRAAQPDITHTLFKKQTIFLPSLPEQSRIVAHLDAVRAETESLEKLYTEKLASLDELRRSVLAEAFS